MGPDKMIRTPHSLLKISLALGILFWAEAEVLAKSCGSVILVSGQACPNLKLKFDLAGCGDASFERETKIECHGDSASAQLNTDLYRYNVELFANPSNGEGPKWEIIGELTQSELDQFASLKSPLPLMDKNQELRVSKAEILAPTQPEEGDSVNAPPSEGGGRSIASVGLAESAPVSHSSLKEANSSGLTVSVMIDGYYSYNFNKPKAIDPEGQHPLITPTNNLRAYDFYHNNIAINVGEITIKKKGEEGSFTADLDVGPQSDYNAAGNGLMLSESGGPQVHGVDEVSKTFGQLYLTYTPLWAPHFILDVGKMATHLGAEDWKSKENWQYSRSVIFTMGLPRWYMGVHLGYELVPEKLQLGGFLYNSINSIYEANATKSLGLQLKYKLSPRFHIAYNFLAGPEEPDNDTYFKTFHEVNFSWDVTPSFAVIGEGLYGRQDQALLVDESRANTVWMGAYLAVKYNFTHKFSVSPRFEVYKDTMGGNLGGGPQSLYSATWTNSYFITQGLETRLEVRQDISSSPKRFITGQGLSNQQGTVALAFIYSME
jgi:hypothetical protein